MTTPASPSSRVIAVDALRGFALVAILLLHNIEHFDFYFFPENLPELVQKTDGIVWNSLFFLFSGKAYSIFALLFGFTFFVQFEKRHTTGKPFLGRFTWRMLLLFAFGMVNSMVYQGDILTFYAAVGLFLIPTSFLKDRYKWFLAAILLIQPQAWLGLITHLGDPPDPIPDPASWALFGQTGANLAGDSFLAAIHSNLTIGKKAVILWSAENGRYTTILGLFILGYLLAKAKCFQSNPTNFRLWRNGLLVSFIVFALFHYFAHHLTDPITSPLAKRNAELIANSLRNLAFTIVLITSFLLLHTRWHSSQLFLSLSAIGRMSLSMYLIQSAIGSTLYYGYGLGLYQYCGATYSFAIGLGISLFLAVFARLWLKRFKHGPLEGIWHRLTWIGVDHQA